MIKFITSSKNKLAEVKAVFPNVEQLDIDLPEIQEIDPHKIIQAKMEEAFNHLDGEFIVEDTSLYFDVLGGLPGPLIKWFMKSMGHDGLYNLCEKLGNNVAVAKTIIGYAKHRGEISFFEGVLRGRIVKPRVDSKFGWDSIFLPDGHEKTIAEMSFEEKNKISMRSLAIEHLKAFYKHQV